MFNDLFSMQKVQEGNNSFIPGLQPATPRPTSSLPSINTLRFPNFLQDLFFILKIYGSLASVLYTEHNLKPQAEEGGG